MRWVYQREGPAIHLYKERTIEAVETEKHQELVNKVMVLGRKKNFTSRARPISYSWCCDKWSCAWLSSTRRYFTECEGCVIWHIHSERMIKVWLRWNESERAMKNTGCRSLIDQRGPTFVYPSAINIVTLCLDPRYEELISMHLKLVVGTGKEHSNELGAIYHNSSIDF